MISNNKIVFVSPGLSGGGAERVASILSNYLCSNGYEVHFISVYNKEREYKLHDEIKYYDTETNKKKTVGFLYRSIKIRNIIKNVNPRIIISFVMPELIMTQLSFKNTIVSLRNDPSNLSTKEKILFYFSMMLSNKIVFQTKDVLDYYSNSFNKKSYIIHNPISDNLPYWNKKNHNNRFITAARLEQQKNIYMMIDAFIESKLYEQDYILEIYGEGSLKRDLQNYVELNKMDNYVYLKGRSRNIHNIMSNSFIFLLSSNYEGISNSMIEALAIGLPCICTDCPPGGTREFINDMDNGILVPVGDKNKMAKAMIMLVTDNNLVDKISDRSIKIREELDVSTIGGIWESLIKM